MRSNAAALRCGLVLTLSVVAAVAVAGTAGATPLRSEAGTGAQGHAAAGAFVAVRRCTTSFGIDEPPPRVPMSLRVSRAAAARHLVAYTNTRLFLLGPARMSCSGIVAADGGTQVLLWPRGERPPTPSSRGSSLVLELEPACTSCRAGSACPFFPALARQFEFPCHTGIPPGERVERPSSGVVLFEDPAGVRGSGLGSGGDDATNGVAAVVGPEQEVVRATCTLPARQRAICTTSLDDVLRRYA
jgi:hypothetical protein